MSDTKKTLLDFVKETSELVPEFVREYDRSFTEYNQLAMIDNAKQRMKEHKKLNTWGPNETKTIAFGDEDGDILGQVYDYMLRAGGKSKSFKWTFHEYHR